MSPINVDVGIIGGSGFYELFGLENKVEERIDTPFGVVKIDIGELYGKKIAFLSRHGKGHKYPPHKINYRANAFAMFKLGANYVLATNAVGSLRENIPPGSIVIPDQIIDFTKNRVYTFFDGEFKIKMKDGREKGGVVHTDVTEPYCNYLREKIMKAADIIAYEHHERWDGKGYPEGLKGEEIPLLSRILSIVDAYDAMRSNRPYRAPISFEEALEEIIKNAGTQFDPQIARIFVEYVHEIDLTHFKEDTLRKS